MASEDVIELGSSDDEEEPAPKRKKPLPNAMVHIPTKLPGITIKPARALINSGPRLVNTTFKCLNMPNNTLAKPIKVGKWNVNSNLNVNKQWPNQARSSLAAVNKNNYKGQKIVLPALNDFTIKPINVGKNIPRPQLVKKVTPTLRLKNPVEIQMPRLLNTLPPGITVTPFVGTSNLKKRQNNASIKNSVGDVLTVEIDDEETRVHASNNSPQWYIRPEDQNESKDQPDSNEIENDKLSIEQENNKEPDISNFVEIIIQDSPVKPLQPKNISESDKDDAITIEDSPIKLIKTKCTDFERDSDQTTSTAEKQSKKKLNYPKSCQNCKVVEIEIDMNEIGHFNDNMNEISDNKMNNIAKYDETTKTDLSNVEKNIDEENNIKESTESVDLESKDSVCSEFHPIYQNFIDLCFKLENTDDMKKIVEKKIKAYYKQCPKEYVESEEFIDMVSNKISLIKSSPDKMYLYIKDIVDELNLQRKMHKTIVQKTENIVKDSESVLDSEEQFDRKKHRQIRKLEKTIKKLHRAIQKLEEMEVDFDDEEDSVYLLTERYKERMVRIHAKLCQYINTKMPSEPRINLETRPGRPAGPVKKLEKWINKKVPIGTPLPFPDFHDVLHCVREANDEDKLGWNEVDMMEEARDLFTRCGKKLQKRRQENEWRLAASRITQDFDPADESSELKKKLDENKATAQKRETEVLNAYADRQNQLKLEGVEIGDKEAEESPDESDEEDIVEDSNVDTKNSDEKSLISKNKTESEEKENKIKGDNDKLATENVSNEESKQHDVSEKLDMKAPDKTTEKDILVTTAQDNIDKAEEIHSDDSHKVDSVDINYHETDSEPDKLNLLEEMHSDFESRASTLSDSDSRIAISDSEDSDSETENMIVINDDVYSIEDSSYSESEVNYDKVPNESENFLQCSVKPEIINSTTQKVSFSSIIARKHNESVEIVENVLSSSDDESSKNAPECLNNYINIKDDDIIISETIINRDGIKILNVNNEGNIAKNSNDDKMSVDDIDNQFDVQFKTGKSPINDNEDQTVTELISIENVDSQVDDCLTVIEADTQSITELNSIESVDSEVVECDIENKSPKCEADTESITELNSIESVGSQAVACNANESPKCDVETQSISDLHSVESVDSQIEHNRDDMSSIETDNSNNIVVYNEKSDFTNAEINNRENLLDKIECMETE